MLPGPNFRLPQDQYVYTNATFQDGGNTGTTRADRTQQFDGENRFEGCIHSMSHTSTMAKIFLIQTLRTGVSLQDVAVWGQNESKNLQQITTLRSGTLAEDP